MPHIIWDRGHLTEDVLEEYSFGRLSEAQTAAVEDHYLACEACQESFNEVESQIHLIRSAFAMEAAATARSEPVPLWSRVAAAIALARRATGAATPAIVWGGALAAASVAMLVTFQSEPPAAPVAVILSSFRGGQAVTMTRGPAGRPLSLSLDAAEVASTVRCRVEVVSATGSAQWEGSAAPVEGRLVAQVPKRLKPGLYWVRLYAPETGLVREFGLQLESPE